MKGSCFVIMPFNEKSKEYYDIIYSRAIKEAGLNPIRVDDLSKPSPILNDIWYLILDSNIMLADITGLNANVMYELGLAHAAGRAVIMITNDINTVPFDLRSLRIIQYDVDRPKWDEKLTLSIKQGIIETLKEPIEAILPTFLDRKPEKRVQISELKSDIIEIKQMLFNQFDRLTKQADDIDDQKRDWLTSELYYEAKSDAYRMYIDDGLPLEEIKSKLREKYSISARIASDILDSSIRK